MQKKSCKKKAGGVYNISYITNMGNVLTIFAWIEALNFIDNFIGATKQ